MSTSSFNTSSFKLKRIIFSRFLSSLSDQFLLFAVPLAIFKSTNDLKYSGLAFIVEWLPRVIMFPVAGFFVDRMRPQHLFFGVELGRAITLIAALIFLAWGVNIFIVLSIMMAFLSVGFILNFVATEAMLPRNIEISELPKAHSMLQGVDQISQVMGPTLAVVVSMWGAQWGELTPILVLAAIMFSISSVNLLNIQTKHVQIQQRLTFAALRESNVTAVRVLLENKVLLHLSALTWVVNLVYGAALVVSAAVVLKVFALPSSHFGALQTSAAVVSIITFGLIPRFTKKFGLQTLGVMSFCAMIFSGLILSLSSHFIIYLLGYVVLVAFDGAFCVYIRTLRSQIIPHEHLGKASGLLGLLNICSIPMSASLVTLLSGYFSPFQIFGIIFALAAMLGIGLVFWGRSVFGYDSWLPSVPKVDVS